MTLNKIIYLHDSSLTVYQDSAYGPTVWTINSHESRCAVMERHNYSFRAQGALNIYNGANSSSNLQAAAIF